MFKRLVAAVLGGGLFLCLQGAVWASSGEAETETEESAYILYDVNDGRLEEADSYLPEQIDRQRAERIWRVFAAIVPAKQLLRVQEYYVNGPENEGGASVIPVDDGLHTWQLSIDEKSVDLQTREDMENLAFLLIHELGHIITLNHEQVDADYSACQQRIELDEGCARQGAYINRFVQQFWTPEMLAAVKNQTAAAVISERYAGHFLDEYAATNPVEDIAESFSVFVEEEHPEDCRVSVAEQKICFFYGFSELVNLRTQIRAGVAEL